MVGGWTEIMGRKSKLKKNKKKDRNPKEMERTTPVAREQQLSKHMYMGKHANHPPPDTPHNPLALSLHQQPRPGRHILGGMEC